MIDCFCKKLLQACIVFVAGFCGIGSVTGQPTADFSANQTSGCSPVSVDFQDQSSGTVNDYLWDFGNGNTSTKQNPSAIYTQPGTYKVELTVTNSNGQDTETKTNYITIFANPKADFSVSAQRGCAPKSINFTDQSQKGSGTIQDWTWDLGDGSVSNQQNPNHQYTSGGTYNVSLVIKDDNGCTDNVTKNDLMTIREKPKVDFSVDDSIACKAPFQVQFSEEAQTQSGGNLDYNWDFGDGNTSTNPNPSHNYQSNGIYAVSLKVTDTAGCKESIQKSNYIIVEKEEADFAIFDKNGCSPHKTSFKNLSGPKIPGTTYEWDFGDGDTSTTKKPNHTYDSAGDYTVKLKVANQKCPDSLIRQDEIKVYPDPSIDFSANKKEACKTPFQVDFSTSGADKSIIKQWQWTFSPGNTSNKAEPSHTFKNFGTYDISLTATDTAGCEAKLQKDKFIKIQKPNADFDFNAKSNCIPATVDFDQNANALSSIVSYQWDFDNGNTSSDPNPTETYNQTGIYNPQLTITTQKGCKDSNENTVKIGDKTNPDFTADKKEGCLEEMKNVQFTNFTNNNQPQADSFRWHFGDGKRSKVKDPVHDYYGYKSSTNSKDLLNVKLISFQNKCPDTIEKKKFITLKPPFADFSYKFVECNEDSAVFKNQSKGFDSLSWDLGDSTQTSDTNPTHRYSNSGKYTVTLTVWNDSTSCKHSRKKEVEVSDAFKASFSAKNSKGCAPLTVDFKGNVNDSAYTQWKLGDGNTYTTLNKTKTYTKPDTYSVKFIATSVENGCRKEIEDETAVIVNGSDIQMTASPKKGCTPLEVTAEAQVKNNATITQQFWDFGNGDTAQYDGTPANYTYYYPPDNQAKGFPLSLITKDKEGCSDTASVKIQPLNPEPEITTSTTPHCDSITYHFSPKEPDSAGLLPIQNQWDFSPGKSYQQQSVSRSFSRDKQVEIVLKMEDAESCTNSDTLSFDFEAKNLKAGFTADTTYGDCPPLEVSFFDLSKKGYAPIADYHWDFGDESYSTKKDPQKLYLLPGRYNVELAVEDTLGCKDTFTGPDYIVLDGPVGDYSLSPLEGCSPLKVTLDSETEGASKIQWDLGDGNVEEGGTINHSYSRSTQYIPLLILSDTSGCTYALPPKDTINVRPSPESRFVADNLCFGYPTRFTDTSIAPASSIEEQQWSFGDGGSTEIPNPNHTFASPGYYRITHAVKNDFNCWDTTTKSLDIGGLEVSFSVTDTAACQERNLQFFDETFADTTIATRKWLFGDGDSSDLENPNKTYADTGFYDVQLAVEDVEGCSDTLRKPRYIGVGDTAPPKVPEIYRATVEESERISLVFGQYDDFDFRRYEIFRKREDQANYKQIHQIQSIKDTQYLDNNTKPLNFSYCYKIRVVSYCNRKSDLDSSRAHCTIELTATPDTNRSLLNWNPYKGWDSVNQYLVKRERLNNEGQFFTIDTVPGTQTRAIDSGIACYKKHRYKITALEAGGNLEFSVSDSSQAKPYYIPDVPSNLVRRATVVNDKNVMVEWTNPPGTVVKNYHLEKSVEGDRYEVLSNEIPGDQLTFTDASTNVKQDNYYYRVQVEDTCGDIGNYSNFGRSILLTTKVNENNRPVLEWSPYLKWQNGVKRYDIELQQPDGHFEVIDQVKGTELNYVDQQTDLNSLPAYVYRVTAREGTEADSATFSVSNEASVEGVSSLHVSNAFTPNGDDINDEFSPEGLYIDDFHMEIYNRWGEFLYETNDMNNGWDGTYRNDACQMDAYIYIIKAVGIDGKHHNKKGDVTLLR